MIIQTIGLDPSGAVWTDDACNVSRLDPSGAVEVDAEHPARDRKVVGSNRPRAPKLQVRGVYAVLLPMAVLASLIIP
jgi:hypothetical protein